MNWEPINLVGAFGNLQPLRPRTRPATWSPPCAPWSCPGAPRPARTGHTCVLSVSVGIRRTAGGTGPPAWAASRTSANGSSSRSGSSASWGRHRRGLRRRAATSRAAPTMARGRGSKRGSGSPLSRRRKRPRRRRGDSRRQRSPAVFPTIAGRKTSDRRNGGCGTCAPE